MINVEIDGKRVEIEPGRSVIEAAQRAGIYIPHFCYHKKLSIAASCRMCLVQVEKVPKPVPACATTVSEGMKVFTASEMAVKAQQGVMEFLLINHPLDCPICDQGGECDLQDIAFEFGSGRSEMQYEKRVHGVRTVGTFLMLERNRCVQCSRCERFSRDLVASVQ